MKPLFSEEEKKQAVRTFIIALKHNQAKISTYEPITTYLDEDRVKILYELGRSGDKPIYNQYGILTKHLAFYNTDDAEKYFEWLIAVVSGTETEGITEDIIKQATDQIFRFIDVLGDNLQIDDNIQLVSPYDWQALFSSFDERLKDMQRIIDKGDKDIVNVLTSIHLFLETNKILLKQILEENETFYRKEK